MFFLLCQDIRSFFTVGAKKPSSTQPTNVSKQIKKKAVIVSSDEDDPPSVKDKKPTNTPTTSNKRRIVYSDDDDNDTPSKKKPNLSKAVKSQPKLKVVEDVSDVFGDEPIKRTEKPVANKTMTEEEINEHFMDDFDVSEVPNVDMNVNEINGKENADEKMDVSVIESTPKQNRQKDRNNKKKSANKSVLDSSNSLVKSLMKFIYLFISFRYY